MRVVTSDALPEPIDGPYAAPHCSVHGAARASTFSPEGFPLWRLVAELEVGTEIVWDELHGDEALYVLEGGLDVDGDHTGGGGAIIVESGAPARARATEATRVIHLGPNPVGMPSDGHLGPPLPDGHGVHVVAEDRAHHLRGGDVPIGVTHYADGSCATCRIALFVVDGRDAVDGYTAASHTHTQDEIIHVLDGELQLGRITVGPGMSIAVPRELRYGFRTDAPFRFLNYRRDVSHYTAAPGSEPLLEVVAHMGPAAEAVD